jgi:murein DD-endopeptidase MepM/ murein hydrolase activator NlpD
LPVLRLSVLLLLFLLPGLQPLQAQSTKPFTLPIALPPGPSTWLLGQPYGNTIGAFINGDRWYSAGQRLHFGLDFSMPCGTPLVAVADGEVAFVDDLGFGSGPHNLLLRHPQSGLISLYGHLLERPTVTPGQPVRQGDVVAYSGDPDETCDSRPHLHFEVRSLDYFTAYNPVTYIEANWHALSAIGAFRYPQFQQDLDNARRWMSIDDQPSVAFGGRSLNSYAAPYPDLRQGQPPANPLPVRDLAPLPEGTSAQLRQLAFEGCCYGAWWHPTDAGRLYAIDGTDNQRAVIFEWATGDAPTPTLVGEAPPPYLSPDGQHELRYADNRTYIRRLSDSAEWSVDTGGAPAALSADSSRLLWQIGRDDGAGEQITDIYVSAADGAGAQVIASVPNGSAQWLDANRLLIGRRDSITTTLGVYDTTDGSSFVLGSWNWLRNLTIAPGGGRLMFYLVYEPESAGLYTIETRQNATTLKLPWFGSWRWRGSDDVFYLPLDASSGVHTLHYYNLLTGEDRALTDPTNSPFTVANGEWSVSAGGSQIAFLNPNDLSLWLLEVAS